MRIKRRAQLLCEYNQRYSVREYSNPFSVLEQYFNEEGLDYTTYLKRAKDKLEALSETLSYKTVSIILYEYPMKTDRPRRAKFGTMYSPNAAENKRYLKRAVKNIISDMKLIHTPGEITIDAYFEMPKKIKPEEVILYEMKKLKVHTTPDYDNIGKCYTDMLKDVIILDDDMFYSGTINKYYSLIPRVVITIRYLSDYDSDYTFRKMKNRKSVKKAMQEGFIEFNIRKKKGKKIK